MNIFILGPQGSGKGTQARIISKNLELFYYESGEVLRELAKSNSRINEIVNNVGALVLDEEVVDIIIKSISEKLGRFDNILFDGSPRTVYQYTKLKEWLGTKGARFDYAIFLDISRNESIKRLSARRECSKCQKIYNLITNPPISSEICECGGQLIQREDDKPDTIAKRLEIYNAYTKPLIEVLEKDGILIKVNGERPVEVIAQEILEKLKQ